jgi:hypothetical protein
MEELLSKIAGLDDVWYATNAEIREYVDAFRRLIYTADGKVVYNPSVIPVYLGGILTKDFIEVLPGQAKELLEPLNM